MQVRVVDIRKVSMLVPQSGMSVAVRVWLPGWVQRIMLVLVVRVMVMIVRVGERLMVMFMLVPLRQV
jgi:hypothetical protein